MSLFGEQIPSLELKNYVMLLQGEPFLTMCYTINSSPLLFTKLFVIMPTIIFRNYQDCPVPLKPLSTSYDLWLILLTDFVEIENFECVQNSRVYIQVSILVHHKHAISVGVVYIAHALEYTTYRVVLGLINNIANK